MQFYKLIQIKFKHFNENTLKKYTLKIHLQDISKKIIKIPSNLDNLREQINRYTLSYLSLIDSFRTEWPSN